MTILPILYHYPKKCEVLEASIFLLVTIFSVGSRQEIIYIIQYKLVKEQVMESKLFMQVGCFNQIKAGLVYWECAMYGWKFP